jgi:chemotaxis protein MotB
LKKKEEKRPEWETSNIGLMMFCSLMIILLAFFIMLASIAVIDERRQIEAMGSVLGAFGLLPGGQSPSQGDMESIAPPTSPMDIIKQDMQILKDVLRNQLVEQKVHVMKSSTQRIISLESTLLFQRDGVDLLPEMIPILKDIAGILKDGNYKITIEGHTDDQAPMTEEFKDNWEISALRAETVLRYFLDLGLAGSRLTAYGYAGNQPIVANTNPKNRARNNRIDLVLDSRQRHVEAFEKGRRERLFFDFKGFDFRLN